MEAINRLKVPNNAIFNRLIEAVRSGKLIQSVIRAGIVTVFIVPVLCALTEFDLLVYSAVCSIYEERGKGGRAWSFTPGEICRIIHPGATGGRSKCFTKKVIESVDRLRSVLIQIDARDEFNLHRKAYMEKRGLKNARASWMDMTGVNWASENPLLALEKTEKVVKRCGIWGDRTETVYTGIAAPILYMYSEITEQFVTVPTDRLNIRKISSKGKLGSSISMTTHRLAMAFRMARDVERIAYRSDNPEVFDKAAKNGRRSHKKKQSSFAPGKKENPVILLSTLFDKCGMDEKTARRHLKDNLGFIQSVMDCWAAQGLVPMWDFRDLNERGKRSFVDAIRFYPGTVSVQQRRAEEASRANGISSIEYSAADTKFGGTDAKSGGTNTKFGDKKPTPSEGKTAEPPWFSALVQAVAAKLRYFKYSISDSPA